SPSLALPKHKLSDTPSKQLKTNGPFTPVTRCGPLFRLAITAVLTQVQRLY
ncbi:hypothetical protein BaRGS_00006940, partial [Batillaria attramentaria]